MADFNLKNKRVLITGSTRGIGAEIARTFHQAGAEVIIHGRSTDLAAKLAKELNTQFIIANLGTESSVESLIKEIQDSKKNLDILINNAGFEIRSPLENFSLRDIDQIYNINLRSVIQLSQGLLPLLKESAHRNKSASVINISSVHESLPYPSNLPYSMMKAALKMFSETLSVEWAPYGIRVNNVAPGAILTDMNREIIENIGPKIFAQWIASGRVGTTQEVANTCLFLASDMASYITGTSILIDGALSKGLLPYGRTKAMDDFVNSI